MIMVIVLSIITALSYLSGVFTMMSALSHGTIFQDIGSSVSFVCGTVALAGASITYQLTQIRTQLRQPRH